jgi:hypothetical protein
MWAVAPYGGGAKLCPYLPQQLLYAPDHRRWPPQDDVVMILRPRTTEANMGQAHHSFPRTTS